MQKPWAAHHHASGLGPATAQGSDLNQRLSSSLGAAPGRTAARGRAHPCATQRSRQKPSAEKTPSRSARLAYPVRDGIPVLLETEARPLSDEEIER